MNKSAAFAILVTILAASSAYAEAPSPQQDPQFAENRKAEEEMMLKHRKEEMLLRVKFQMERVQKEQACIEAAATLDALHSCMPKGKGGPDGKAEGAPDNRGGQSH